MSIAEKLTTIAENQQRVAKILEDCNNHIGAREIEEATNLSALPDKVAEMYDRGEQSGYNTGHNDGYSEGYESGYSDGQQAGGSYTQGQIDLLKSSRYMNNTVTGEVVTIQDISPVEHDVEVKATSKNLFNVNVISATAVNVRRQEDGSVYVNTNSSRCGRTLRELAPSLEVGKTYTLNATTTGNAKYLWFNTANKSWVFGNKLVMTEDYLNSMVYFYTFTDNQSQSAVVSNIQIEEGTVATAYTPYIEDFSDVGIIVSGKNLFDEQRFYADNNFTLLDDGCYGHDSFSGVTVFENTLGIKGRLCVSYSGYRVRLPKNEEAGSTLALQVNYTDGTSGYICGLSNDFTTPTKIVGATTEGKDVEHIKVTYGSAGGAFAVKDIQIEKAERTTDFEPYHTAPVKVVNGKTKSVSPTMVVQSDVGDGSVNVQCTYLRDIDKYIDSLMTSVS